MNNFLNKYWNIITIVVLAAIVIHQCSSPEIKEVKVPFSVAVPVPVVEIRYDTVPNPYPVVEKEIDSTYYKKYIALKEEKERDSLFKEAITIREYKETIEDDTITIDLYMQTQGFLKEYQVGYKTKPRTIVLDTTLKIPIPVKNELYIGPSASLGADLLPSIQINGILIPKRKKTAYSLGYDPFRKEGRVGILFKF